MRQSVVSCGGEMLDTIAYRFDVYTVGRSGGVFDMYGGDEMRVCRLVLVPLSGTSGTAARISDLTETKFFTIRLTCRGLTMNVSSGATAAKA